jgi:hypothetical protein
MTLLYTEISREFPGHGRCVFFAADRRIFRYRGTPQHYRKLVDVPYLNSALGFFGLAEFRTGRTIYRLTDHLGDFVRHHHFVTDLAEFAERLAHSLNNFVPLSLRRSQRSGIHLAGIASSGLPEFWFIRNVNDSGDPTPLGTYVAREDYLRRDAPANGFDGADRNTLPSFLYRNGDIVSHVAAWEALDDSLGNLLDIPQFHPVKTPERYAKWIRFKMEVLTRFHKQFARTLLVGGWIDFIIKSERGLLT